MRTPLHPNPSPTAPRIAAPRLSGQRAAARLARPLAVLALAPLVLARCTDDVAANCPPLAHPEVLTVAAAGGNPCTATTAESAALLALRIVRTYQRTSALAAGLPTRYPLRCGDAGTGTCTSWTRSRRGAPITANP